MISRVILGAYSLFIFLVWPVGLLIDSTAYFADISPAFEYAVHENVRYYNGPDAHETKHLLDIYNPRTESPTQVLMFVHGGSWEDGDKALYRFIGNNFASRGYTTVVINYRLSPAVRHPAHVQDVARAFAWVHNNIDTYGGDPDQITLMGHSAGGHLVSLLSVDERYLAEQNLSTNQIKRVISISGVYDLTQYWSLLFADTFDTDEESRADASPITHVDSAQPPFLILYAQFDYPTLDSQALAFFDRLAQNNTFSKLVEIPSQTHVSIVLSLGREDEETTKCILEFLESNL